MTCLMNEWPTRVRTGVAAVLADDLGHRLRADQVVEDRRRRAASSSMRHGDIAVVVEPDSGRALLVDEEHAVGVAVEREADVGADLAHPGLRGRAGSRAGSGRPGGSGTCRRARRTGSRARTAGRSNTAGTTRPPMPLAVSATTFSGRSAPRSTNERTWSANVVEQVAASAIGAGASAPAVDAAPRPVALISVEAGVLADRPGAGQAELDAVVLRRVVRRGEHRARARRACPRRSTEVGRGQAEVDDVDALRRDAVGERARQLDARSGACRGRRARVGRRRRSGRTRRRSRGTTSASSWSGTVPRTS